MVLIALSGDAFFRVQAVLKTGRVACFWIVVYANKSATGPLVKTKQNMKYLETKDSQRRAASHKNMSVCATFTSNSRTP